ncbi:Trehalase [Fulvia fulva]|nr:Trehalase [Fulvia fulva]KAK4638487.1 Trehalase [Fulvia fulva]WPV10047.1 Trehalase [Fulvia fulva]WPV23351.1 Trehalase [Fulvia fulva]
MASWTLLAASIPFVTALWTNGSVTAPCESPLYCQGEILREIQLAGAFEDSKTYVDLPTIRPLDEVIAAFGELSKPLSNNTELNDFLSTYFGEAGSELREVDPESLQTNATFRENVNNTDIREFLEIVIDIWPELTREYAGDTDNCTECVSSFIPLNRTFVVAGGRFREPYYWDSYWILLGLLRTQGSFTEIALNTIENFADLVNRFGFVPNGARQYYLNRSQPPVLALMVEAYVEYTNDTSVLGQLLPTLEREYSFWTTNRSVDVEVDGTTYTLNRYAVENNQPRPESYTEDYHTATNTSYYAESGIIYPATELNESQIAQLYSDLASGAESGWDYTSRWISNPSDAIEDVYFPLRSLNTANIIPVDLNSILYANEIAIADFHTLTGNSSAASAWTTLANTRSEAMAAIMWDQDQWSYYDYNLTSSRRQTFITTSANASINETFNAPAGQQHFTHIAQFYPFWTGAAPPYLKNNPSAILHAFEPIINELSRFPGVPAATNLETEQQWDEPNVWPPLTYILIAGLLNTPPTFGEEDPSYIATQDLALEIAQRYLDSAFCTWRETGGSTSSLPTLENIEPDNDFDGAIFEKYDSTDVTAFGGGGEYTVQTGFGWTNGVLLWVGDLFGGNLTVPVCERELEEGGDGSDDGNGDGGARRSRTAKRNVKPARKADARWRREKH